MNATIAVPPDGPYFAGHFPGRPILPGVALLALIVAALAHAGDRPATVRAIPFARLRQLVAPGEVLELAARDTETKGTRVDVKRAGAVVANGELVLGPPEEVPGGLRLVPGSRPPDPMPPIDALLPHRPPMRFVTAIVDETPDGLTCTARVPSACALVAGGAAPALTAIECAAQTAALWEATRRWRAGGAAAARIGYLVALREMVFFAERVPAEQALMASVRLQTAAPPLTHYAVEVVVGAAPILRGTIATFLTDQRAS